MIQLIGLNNNCSIDIREKLSITESKLEDKLKNLINVCDEALIISTCNRTEIYFNSKDIGKDVVLKIFNVLDWDIDLIENTFYINGAQAVKHLMEVCSGFHSKILGEDQILGQIKKSYDIAFKNNCLKYELQRLFQYAITCGKEFRFKSELYKIPVSSSSIAIKEVTKRQIKKIMIIGFGEVGGLCYKYLEDYDFEKVYIVVRNPNKIKFNDVRVDVISFKDKVKYIDEVQCIISCTSAPHIVLYKEEIGENNILIFDLAVPRDVDYKIASMSNVELYDIDRISLMDKENKLKRKAIMEKNRYIVESYINEFLDWQKLRELSPIFEDMSIKGEDVYRKRYYTFKRKRHTKDNDKLVETLLKSTSDFYIHRAIEVLKEEELKGRGKECLRILEKIFMRDN